MKTLPRIASLALILLTPLTALIAAPLNWDPGATGGVNPGGSGNWDTVSSLWFNGAADVAWINANNDDAIFTNTAGTVTLTENITAGDIYFTNVTGNYVITNATGAEILTVGNVIDTGGGEHAIGAPVANAGTLNKNGDGRLHMAAVNSLNNVMVNQGEFSVENNSAAGNAVTVADGAALEFNGTNNQLNAVYTSVTINGSGITNSGALRNLSGTTTYYGAITLGENNSVIYADSGSALVYDGSGPLTDNGNNYNLIVSGSGTGNFFLGQTSLGGSLIVKGRCYAYLNSISPTVWKSTYVAPGATFFVENNNGFGANANPSSLITTNCIVDGGAIASGGTYTMFVNDGITVTTNGGSFTNSSGTWTTGSIYSPSNGSVAFTAVGTATIAIAVASSTTSVLNIGTGTLTLNGGNTKLQSGVSDIFSNLVINGSTFTFNYDSTSGQPDNLGSLPSTFSSSNIWLNGGQFHVGHSTTIQANRGIYVTSAGTTINEVTSGGTATLGSAISGPGTVTFASQNYVLTGNNSYGNTTINASTVVKVGNNGAAGTLGAGNTTDNGTLNFNRTGAYTYGGAISGSGIVTETASGTVTLTGKSTYTGATTISAGTLLMNNTNASAITVNSGGTLGGSGVFGGTITVSAGGTLALGGGTLSVSNNVSIAGNVSASLNKSLAASNGMAVVSGTLANTGTGSIIITNLGPALVVGDTFQLFNQPVTGAGSMPVTGGGAGVTWNNNLAVDGTISVATATAPKPVINQVQVSNGNFIFSGTNGSGTYYVLSSTNIALPLSQWTYVSTNTFLGNGQFFITNPLAPGNPQQFYLLKTP